MMSVPSHVSMLKRKHAVLDKKIHDQEVSAHPDETQLHDLKRKKLKVKDEIERMSHAGTRVSSPVSYSSMKLIRPQSRTHIFTQP